MAWDGRTDLIEEFTRSVVGRNPMHANFLQLSLEGISGETRRELHQYLEYCVGRNLPMAYLVDSYNMIVLDTQKEQIYFRKHKKYRCSTFKEVADQVYFDETYMKKYMYGLALTAFLWPNHAAMHDFFVRTFPKGRKGAYLEIGPGHGYYFRTAALLGNFDHMMGIDISATSVALTRDLVGHLGARTEAKIEIVEKDFLEMEKRNSAYACVVMGEVLEHVEDPGVFLAKIAQISCPETHIYITTCLNAPAIDHISLFRTSAEVEELARSNGLETADRLCAPYTGKTLTECEAEQLPVNVAYVLRKR